MRTISACKREEQVQLSLTYVKALVRTTAPTWKGEGRNERGQQFRVRQPEIGPLWQLTGLPFPSAVRHRSQKQPSARLYHAKDATFGSSVDPNAPP